MKNNRFRGFLAFTVLSFAIPAMAASQVDSGFNLESRAADQFFELEKPALRSYVYALETPYYSLRSVDGAPVVSESDGIKDINWERKDRLLTLPKFPFFSPKNTTVGVLKGSWGASGGSTQTLYFLDTESGNRIKIHIQNNRRPEWILEDGLPVGVKTQRWDSLGPRAFSLGYAPRTDRILVFSKEEEKLVRSTKKEQKLFESELASIEFSDEELSELAKPFFDIDRQVGEKFVDYMYYSARTNQGKKVGELLRKIGASDLLKEETDRSLKYIE